MLVTKVGVTLNCTCQHFRYTLCLSLCMHTLCFSAARTCVCIMCFMGGMRPRSCVHATVMPRVVSSSAFSHFKFFFFHERLERARPAPSTGGRIWPSPKMRLPPSKPAKPRYEPVVTKSHTGQIRASDPHITSRDYDLPQAPVVIWTPPKTGRLPPQNRGKSSPGKSPENPVLVSVETRYEDSRPKK